MSDVAEKLLLSGRCSIYFPKEARRSGHMSRFIVAYEAQYIMVMFSVQEEGIDDTIELISHPLGELDSDIQFTAEFPPDLAYQDVEVIAVTETKIHKRSVAGRGRVICSLEQVVIDLTSGTKLTMIRDEMGGYVETFKLTCKH